MRIESVLLLLFSFLVKKVKERKKNKVLRFAKYKCKCNETPFLLYGLFRKWYACISVQYSLLLGFHCELIWSLTLYLHSFTGIDFVHFNVLAFLSYNNIVVLIKQVESYVYTHFWAPTHECGGDFTLSHNFRARKSC